MYLKPPSHPWVKPVGQWHRGFRHTAHSCGGSPDENPLLGKFPSMFPISPQDFIVFPGEPLPAHDAPGEIGLSIDGRGGAHEFLRIIAATPPEP